VAKVVEGGQSRGLARVGVQHVIRGPEFGGPLFII
jgi:hypothetical protein